MLWLHNCHGLVWPSRMLNDTLFKDFEVIFCRVLIPKWLFFKFSPKHHVCDAVPIQAQEVASTLFQKRGSIDVFFQLIPLKLVGCDFYKVFSFLDELIQKILIQLKLLQPRGMKSDFNPCAARFQAMKKRFRNPTRQICIFQKPVVVNFLTPALVHCSITLP